MSDFKQKYGPWALIAGGAQGIGAAYGRYCAARGINLAVIDYSEEALNTFCPAISEEFAVQCLPIPMDLGADDRLLRVREALGDRQIGLLVYNAAIATVGPFYKPDSGLAMERSCLGVNVVAPLELVYEFAAPMLARQHGGIVLMSSGASLQGSPFYAHYAATKAYALVLAESLWGEFKPYHVDVIACVAGMTLSSVSPAYEHLDTSGFQTPEEVVAETMAALGDHCSIVTGENNRRGRELSASLSREQLVDFVGQHAVQSFFAGETPAQKP